MVDSNNTNALEFGYLRSFDGLRGLSIIAVVAFNSQLQSIQGGFVGVDIFFVLSGFLITTLLVQNFHRTAGIGLKHFYVRRALRLFPALFALLLFYAAYAFLFQPAGKAVATLRCELYTLFYVANWVQVPPYSTHMGGLSHTWSLSVEEQFYIVWPVILLGLLRIKSKGMVLAILISLISVSVAINIWLWQSQVPFLRMYFGSDTRSHELLIGCVAALLMSWGVFQNAQHLRGAFHAAAIFSFVGIVLSLFLTRHNTAFVYNGGFALISIGTAILILDMLLFPSMLSRGFEFAPLVWIGKISYGLYLWHYPIFEATRRLLEGRVPPLVYQITGVVTTVLVATASFYLLEKPFLKLRRRFSTENTGGPGLIPQSQTAAGI